MECCCPLIITHHVCCFCLLVVCTLPGNVVLAQIIELGNHASTALVARCLNGVRAYPTYRIAKESPRISLNYGVSKCF